MTTCERLPQSGLPQMELPLTQSAEGSRVRISASRVLARELRASAAAYGESTPVSLASYNQSTSSWRTSQRCLVGGWSEFSETWPRSGTMRNGIAYQLPPLAPLTDATGFGLWQTPVADDAIERTVGKWNSRGEPKLSAQVKLWPTPLANDAEKRGAARVGAGLPLAVEQSLANGMLSPLWVEWLMGFPIGWTDCEPLETP